MMKYYELHEHYLCQASVRYLRNLDSDNHNALFTGDDSSKLQLVTDNVTVAEQSSLHKEESMAGGRLSNEANVKSKIKQLYALMCVKECVVCRAFTETVEPDVVYDHPVEVHQLALMLQYPMERMQTICEALWDVQPDRIVEMITESSVGLLAIDHQTYPATPYDKPVTYQEIFLWLVDQRPDLPEPVYWALKENVEDYNSPFRGGIEYLRICCRRFLLEQE